MAIANMHALHAKAPAYLLWREIWARNVCRYMLESSLTFLSHLDPVSRVTHYNSSWSNYQGEIVLDSFSSVKESYKMHYQTSKWPIPVQRRQNLKSWSFSECLQKWSRPLDLLTISNLLTFADPSTPRHLRSRMRHAGLSPRRRLLPLHLPHQRRRRPCRGRRRSWGGSRRAFRNRIQCMRSFSMLEIWFCAV